ncbi:glycerophosphodiester phosphodiesterase GDPDL3-like isoform X2 [Macadamia integrifolia]|uniref:glycerophosphodiester phosphodiesterase GDPDL3-like isoform X2 n=1 Tax=Macadamia integrifolia TaxID=60698 RepID=UPI001C533469|nr:glycerophosphodiester phosphodiesterase GDPDL3-like isoform X2 [Macadamia integrifolia]
MPILRSLFVLFLLHQAAVVTSRGSKGSGSWQTLSGNAPLVVARGGFSGMFPDSSLYAYNFALQTSLADVILWCDVQLTKDEAGICFPTLNLDNSSDISNLFPNQNKVYNVNGVPVKGWFSVDYTLNQLSNVTLYQGIFSRSGKFDGISYILTAEDVFGQTQVQPPGFWLNIQHDAFFKQHNLSMRSYVLSVSKRVIVNYISSPEVGFLSSISSRFKGTTTKLVFRFLGMDDVDPSTNQTYGSLLSNLTFVKTFASGILVPKTYIWPVNTGLYLQSPTSVVSDAHNEGLEVFASDFANDVVFSYNYSYDPVAEYLSFIDNGNFSVDGVLSDFPITPSEAIDCFSHIGKNSTGQVSPVVITHNGASGVYPGCTDVAYQQAVEDGADVIDCSVQMTSDGIPICFSSIDLIDGTTVSQTVYNTRSVIIPELQNTAGVFTFNLTWKEIQNLQPAISNPFAISYQLYRYPAHKNSGSLVSLDYFLSFAKTKPLSGVLVSVENAAYLAEYQGLNVIGAVMDSLNKSGHNNQTLQKVMIQSTNSSVLKEFKKRTSYELVYQVDETIRDALNLTIKDIKGFSHSVSVTKQTIFPVNQQFLTGVTDVVNKFHSYNLSVYAYVFTNEFVSQAWDFYSDPIVEINTFVSAANIDGLITDFPGTAVSYRKNKCLNLGNNTPNYMLPVSPGPPDNLLSAMAPGSLPPAEAPNPILTNSDVIEPPMPSVVKKLPTSGTHVPAAAPTASTPNGQPRRATGFFLSSLLSVLLAFLFF